MKTFIISIIILISALVFPVAGAQQEPSISVSEIQALVNEYRQQNGLNPVELDSRLVTAAQIKAQDMATRNYFAHTNPDGQKVYKLIGENCYYYLTAGENLAVDFEKSENIVKAWIKSPSHNSVMLDPKFEDTGIGIAEVDGHIYVVQLFAKEQQNNLTK